MGEVLWVCLPPPLETCESLILFDHLTNLTLLQETVNGLYEVATPAFQSQKGPLRTVRLGDSDLNNWKGFPLSKS